MSENTDPASAVVRPRIVDPSSEENTTNPQMPSGTGSTSRNTSTNRQEGDSQQRPSKRKKRVRRVRRVGPRDRTPSDDPATTEQQDSKPKRVRTGCLTCRRRHLKCDENFPVCDHCTKTSRTCKRGMRITFQYLRVEDVPVHAPGRDVWPSTLRFEDESRNIANEYQGGRERYEVSIREAQRNQARRSIVFDAPHSAPSTERHAPDWNEGGGPSVDYHSSQQTAIAPGLHQHPPPPPPSSCAHHPPCNRQPFFSLHPHYLPEQRTPLSTGAYFSLLRSSYLV